MADLLKHPAANLRAGDVVWGTGETIISVSAGVRTPSGKVDVVLEKDGRRRTATWNRRTLISFRRPDVG